MKISVGLLAVVVLCVVAEQVNGLHFFLEPGKRICFTEDIPNRTNVVGEYRALTHNPADNTYIDIPANGITVAVTDIYDGHEILNIKGDSHNVFAFTSNESGDHEICIGATSTSWFHGNARKLKVTLSLKVGEGSKELEGEKLDELTSQIRELNDRVTDIRRQQEYQKEQEAKFRDTSESVNSRAVWFIILQVIVLVVTTTWQMRHMYAFLKTKKVA